MMVNQNVIKDLEVARRQHTETSARALSEIKKHLTRRNPFWKKMCDDINQGLSPVEILGNKQSYCLPIKDKSDVSDVEWGKKLLTPAQADGIEKIQRLCGGINKACQQLNTVIVTHELDLPKLMLIEMSELLLRADGLIAESKRAAAKLGVRAVQPKVKLSYLYVSLNGNDRERKNGTSKQQIAEKIRA